MNDPTARILTKSAKSFTTYEPTPEAASPTTIRNSQIRHLLTRGRTFTKLEDSQNPYDHERPIAPHKDSNPTGKEALH